MEMMSRNSEIRIFDVGRRGMRVSNAVGNVGIAGPTDIIFFGCCLHDKEEIELSVDIYLSTGFRMGEVETSAMKRPNGATWRKR
jgi:hypothetical protein